MSIVQRSLNYLRNNPVATYIVVGIVLSTARNQQVRDHYLKHYHRFDVERKQELEEYLANGGKLHQDDPKLNF
ncbi:UNKNOWN [Stylonychia lemnae]|uniref:Uncharacterized protein n=1 Tax=Stylonychia lemnae TaxID=5949 RepID=A0A078ACN0_STYLE|nr:UNKNOWN [Stylonychia lemnae]|eukprot:CDW78593.1 UNKNOWN [Stylonychia lemnae]